MRLRTLLIPMLWMRKLRHTLHSEAAGREPRQSASRPSCTTTGLTAHLEMRSVPLGIIISCWTSKALEQVGSSFDTGALASGSSLQAPKF